MRIVPALIVLALASAAAAEAQSGSASGGLPVPEEHPTAGDAYSGEGLDGPRQPVAPEPPAGAENGTNPSPNPGGRAQGPARDDAVDRPSRPGEPVDDAPPRGADPAGPLDGLGGTELEAAAFGALGMAVAAAFLGRRRRTR